MKLRASIALLVLSAGVLSAASAAANGRFPAANQIVVDPSDPSHIVVRTTYGLVASHDGGQAWDWICEQAVEWTGQYDPSVAITKDGSLIAGVYDHLGVGTQGGCAWGRPVPLEQKNVVDVSTQKDDPAVAVALTSNAQNGVFLTQVWRSSNNAKDWAQLGVDLPTNFVALTLDVAPSDPSFIAVTGQIGQGGPGVLQRSTDGGMIWEQRAIPGTDAGHAPYLAAIDPGDPLKLYVRLSGPKGPVLVSPDGGDTWKEAFVGQGILKGFALSPDGSELLVGGESDGIHHLSTTDLAAEKVSEIRAQCLAWTDGGVYVCAPEAKDGFTIGWSADAGTSFMALNHLACVRGPLSCDAATEAGKACPSAWPTTAELIDQPSCEQGAGGLGSAGGTGGAAPTAAGTGGTGAAGRDESHGGCGVSTHDGGDTRSGLAVLLLAALPAFARRRRRSAEPHADSSMPGGGQ